MKHDIKRSAVLGVILLSLVVFTATVARAFQLVPPLLPPSPPGEESDVPPEGEPLRLFIPEIDVDAPVESVGLTQGGNMAVPWSASAVGWYRYGAAPGDNGSAVMAGHVDSGISHGVFGRLKELKEGDDIYVLLGDTSLLHFVVSKAESYPYMEVPADVVFAQNDKPRLNLITCTGSWVFEEKTFDERLVVFAEFEGKM